MAISNPLEEKYNSFYSERNPVHVYPVEFVVRAFLGNYPRLKTDESVYPGKRVLDLGFGDGRNMPLLHNLGMQVYGAEISEKICDLATTRMESLGIEIDARVGRNCALPFENAFFDYVLACHACYYIDPGTHFDDNLQEIARVLKPGGTFVCSAPMPSSYILRDAKDLGEGHMKITSDPYRLRNGYVLMKFDDEADIERVLSPTFEAFSIGSCQNDFWGIEEHVWIVVCRRTEAGFNCGA